MIQNAIAKTHHLVLTSEVYNSMKEFLVGIQAIKNGSIKQQIMADMYKQGLS